MVLTVADWQKKYSELEVEVKELKVLVQWYENQLLNAKRRIFGTSSEKSDISYNQINLFGVPEIAPPPEPETETISYKRKKRVGKREEDLSDLPVERIDYEIPESERSCPECGETMSDIGVKVRQELKIVPAKIVVVEHAKHTYACHNCEQNEVSTPIVQADTPPALIPGSLASASLISHIVMQKYFHGMPLYRIERGFLYNGANISRQVMAGWVIKVSDMYLYGIYQLMIKNLLTETVAHADETTLQVLHEPGRAAQTKSYMWIYRTSGCSERKIVIYDYKETRNRTHPAKFLAEFSGYLHTDGYEVYHNLPPGIIVVGCWSHVRRKFEAILKSIPKDDRKGSNAETAMAYINALFDFERKFAELTPEERYQKRLECSKPVADAFFAWAESLGALPKSPLGQAVSYALNQQEYLNNVWLDGRTELSNNRAERSVKPFVMGRKSWLFSDTPEGARASSVMYSIVETARENNLHPERYIEYLLETLPKSSSSDMEALLPWSNKLPSYCNAPAQKQR